jgi:uncharacterized protein
MKFKPTLWEANPLVEETVNQVAIKYGPLVYCLESNDLPEGVKLKDLALSLSSPTGFVAERETIAGAEVLTFKLKARALPRADWTDKQLYREVGTRTPRTITVKAVPYYAWGNRGDTEMTVWIPAR